MDALPPLYTQLIVTAANEGLPIAVMARIFAIPFADVEITLKEALDEGRVLTMPRADWPSAGGASTRAPSVPRLSRDQVELAASTQFKLTKLEAAFLGALLQYDHTEKERLYGIAEQQRQRRQTRVIRDEPTDPRIVDVMICKLRKKLRTYDPAFVIGTTWGRGYSIDAPVKKSMLDVLNKPSE